MGKARRKLSHRSQTVALLFPASGFANPVGHEADETLRQFRHLLHKLREKRRRKTQDPCVCGCARIQRKLLHSRKGQDTGHVTRIACEHHGFTAEFAAKLELSFQHDKHGVGRVALAEVDLSRVEVQLFRMADEPVDLVLREIGERGDVQQIRSLYILCIVSPYRAHIRSAHDSWLRPAGLLYSLRSFTPYSSIDG